MKILIFLYILVLCAVGSIDCAASNSYSDCNTLAAKFDTTCGGTAVSNIVASTGVNVSCSSGFTSSNCPGTMYGSTCVFQHKLCVTCTNASPVRIRVQTNGLPRYCPNVPNTLSELNIDFEVNFNPDVSVNSPTQNPSTVAALSSIVCSISNQASVPSSSNYTSTSSAGSMGTLAGVSIDGVTILNVNSANNVDPFFPAGGYAAESVDACLGHPNPSNNGYHYHAGSACAVNRPTGNISTCASTPACSANVANYSISLFSAYRNLTVTGIGKDGHIIYGPYTSGGVEVTSGFDICNGMFHDSTGNYGYFTTRTYPYITGCFGPGNYPSFSVNCSTNAPSSYTKSTYAQSQTVLTTTTTATTSTSATTTTATTTTTTTATTATTTSGNGICLLDSYRIYGILIFSILLRKNLF